MSDWHEAVKEGFLEFKTGFLRGQEHFLSGIVFAFALADLLLCILLCFFSLYHRDYPIAVYCLSLFVSGGIGYRWGRRKR